MFNIIFAIDKNHLVGNTNAKFGLPWHYPEDLKYYKKMTTNQICVMGRHTYEAIGSALPNRTTYVLTRDVNYKLDDAIVINDINEVTTNDNETIIWICGGVSVFKQFWNKANVIYITKIDNEHSGDVYFNDYDLQDYKLESVVQGDDKQLTFEKWVKNDNKQN